MQLVWIPASPFHRTEKKWWKPGCCLWSTRLQKRTRQEETRATAALRRGRSSWRRRLSRPRSFPSFSSPGSCSAGCWSSRTSGNVVFWRFVNQLQPSSGIACSQLPTGTLLAKRSNIRSLVFQIVLSKAYERTHLQTNPIADCFLRRQKLMEFLTTSSSNLTTSSKWRMSTSWYFSIGPDWKGKIRKDDWHKIKYQGDPHLIHPRRAHPGGSWIHWTLLRPRQDC